MGHQILSKYFQFVTIFLYSLAALPEKRILKKQFKTVLLNKIWPLVFFFMWHPIVFMAFMKLKQFISEENWDGVLDMMNIILLGVNGLYYAFAAQQTSKLFKVCMDVVLTHFLTCSQFNVRDLKLVIALKTNIIACFCFYIGGSVYYREVLLPLWVPFIDNTKDYSEHVFYIVWMFELLVGVYLVIVYGIFCPFVIVITKVTITELDYLLKTISQFEFEPDEINLFIKLDNIYPFKTTVGGGGKKFRKINETVNLTTVTSQYGSPKENTTNLLVKDEIQQVSIGSEEKRGPYMKESCVTKEATSQFINDFVTHHLHIQRVIRALSKIHNYVFMTQYVFTTSHSCFLAFSLYYTNHLTKQVVKSSPILVLSYYTLFIYCLNGQKLTDKCEELFRALYECSWHNCPHSFKTSLMIMMQFCRLQVTLKGGGFTASLETFLQGVQQSISYILILKGLTPEHKS